ncbi:MAG: helix-turn-helix domain-containing protein [Nanoarchaeota archaeon]
MLLKIITKKLNYRIMGYLIDREGTVTTIAKDTGNQKENVSKALRELEGRELVVKEIIGRSHKYSLNCLHPEANEIIKLLLINQANELNVNLEGLPKFIDAYLKMVLKEDYSGLIVFGSALTYKYRDIDIFIITSRLKSKDIIIKNLKEINAGISPIIGAEKELEGGFKNNDSLYANIVNGIPFGCLDFVISLRFGQYLRKRKDIEERYLIGYREIQSCKEFKDDKRYIKNHLEKGIFDIAYALLNYKQMPARNDSEAKQFFKKVFKRSLPSTLKQAGIFAEKMRNVIFY